MSPVELLEDGKKKLRHAAHLLHVAKAADKERAAEALYSAAHQFSAAALIVRADRIIDIAMEQSSKREGSK